MESRRYSIAMQMLSDVYQGRHVSEAQFGEERLAVQARYRDERHTARAPRDVAEEDWAEEVGAATKQQAVQKRKRPSAEGGGTAEDQHGGGVGGVGGGGGDVKKGRAKCPHNRRRSECKQCDGASICEHNRQKSRCKDRLSFVPDVNGTV